MNHLDPQGNARMVDVGEKPVTQRVAVAEGWVRLGEAARTQVAARTARKGDVLGIAQIAGIQAAKQTGSLIPLCHPLPLDAVDLTLALEADGVHIVARVACTGRTGVEMEALTAVSVAALTVYDMLKAVERGIVIDGLRLLRKEGGRSGVWEAP